MKRFLQDVHNHTVSDDQRYQLDWPIPLHVKMLVVGRTDIKYARAHKNAQQVEIKNRIPLEHPGPQAADQDDRFKQKSRPPPHQVQNTMHGRILTQTRWRRGVRLSSICPICNNPDSILNSTSAQGGALLKNQDLVGGSRG